MSDKCEYPNCRCPFDMGPDNQCLMGKPNTDTTPPVRTGESVAVPEEDPLPCPFCGSSDVGGAGGTVGCYRCPAEIAVQNTNTAYAVELWNNRASAELGGGADAKITTEMKAQCMGEFEFAIDVPCGECLVEGEDEDCEVCSGELTHQRFVEVPWDTCKEIYKRMAKFAPKAQGVPNGWKDAADRAIRFCDQGHIPDYPRIAAEHIRGLARLLLTTPAPEADKEYDPADDPLFKGPDVTVDQALDAMEDERQLDEKHCYTDIIKAIDPEELPLCPLCDQPIMRGELVDIGTAAGAIALIHEDCANQLKESE